MSYKTDDNGKLIVSGSVLSFDRTFFELKYEDILSDDVNYTVRISATLITKGADTVTDAPWVLSWCSKARATVSVGTEDENQYGQTIARAGEDGLVTGKFTEEGSELVLSINTNKPIRGIAFGTQQSKVTSGAYEIRINEISFTPFVAVEGFGISNKTDLASVRTDDADKKIEYTYTNKTGDGAATPFTVKYESSDDEILSVDEDGNLIPHKKGDVTVKAYVDGQKGTEDTVDISVVHVPVESVSITRNGTAVADTIEEDINGEKVPYGFSLGYTVTGNPCAYKVEWESSDEGVATVNNDGLVTVKATGTTRITVSVVGQTATKTINLVVKDSSKQEVVSGISIKVNDETAGSDDIVVRVGQTVTLGYEATASSENYEVEWLSDNEQVAAIPEGSKNAKTVTLNILKTGKVTISVKVKNETAVAYAVLDAKNPLVTAIALDGVNATETMNVGETKDFTVVPTPAVCDEYKIDVTYTTEGVTEVRATETGFKLVPLKKGTTTITLTVRGLSVSVSFDLTVNDFISQSEDFAKGSIVNGVYYGENFNAGARLNSKTKVNLTTSENGIEWNTDPKSDGRITFGYKNIELLDFADNKKYVVRVTVHTPSDYPADGYITIFGTKKTASNAYETPNASGVDDVATVSGSTARVLLAGGGAYTYYDFVISDENRSEFFLAYHSASNSSKSGGSKTVTITDITIFEANSYKDYDEIEDFEGLTADDSINKYVGTNFEAIVGGGAMAGRNTMGTEFSARMSGRSLYYSIFSVYKEGLSATEDDPPVSVTAPRIVFTYKGEIPSEDNNFNYKLRIPMYMTAGDKVSADLVKTTTAKLFYCSANAAERLIETRVIGYNNTLTVLEGEIPANDWNGNIIIKFYNSEVTKSSQASAMRAWFDSITLTKLN